jgi:hypothetical protein
MCLSSQLHGRQRRIAVQGCLGQKVGEPIGKLWKQPRCPTTDEWIKKMYYFYTMELYSAIKNEMLSFAGKWMEPENIILSEVSQVQKAKSCMFSLICGI